MGRCFPAPLAPAGFPDCYHHAMPATDGHAPVRFATYAMGQQPAVDLTKALRLAAELEDEEIARKLALGK